MYGNIDLFTNLSDISSPVGLPNGKSTTATKEGRVILSDNLTLDNVLYVPALKCNLLAVSQLLEKQSYSVMFTDKLCIIQDRSLRNLIGAGEQCDGVYIFRPVQAFVGTIFFKSPVWDDGDAFLGTNSGVQREGVAVKTVNPATWPREQLPSRDQAAEQPASSSSHAADAVAGAAGQPAPAGQALSQQQQGTGQLAAFPAPAGGAYGQPPPSSVHSLPDAIITVILSLLPIDTAAATSVLSHRWRRLWTAVTSLEFHADGSTFTTTADHILAQLTAPTLRVFHLSLTSPSELPESDSLESSFREVCRRNVESVFIDVRCSFYEEFFYVPVCLFNSVVILDLELVGKLKFDFADDEIGGVVLPNLRKLSLNYLLDVPFWLGNLIRCCQKLEDLDLVFKLDVVESEIADSVNICALNLKLLKIDLEFVGQTQHINISIDAPQLEYLNLRDCTSFYDFVRSPTRLVRTCIDLIKEERYLEDEDDMDWLPSGDYLRHMSKFIGGMCSVSSLDLKLDSDTNIFTHLSSVGNGFLPVFRNLTNFEMTLDGIGLNGWKDLILSLQCFPNLKHLEVNMEGDPPMDLNHWSEPGSVPDCLVSKMKTIQIRGLIGIDDDLKLLAYILSNAVVLNELCLDVCMRDDSNDLLWKERKFCMSLFKLPRKSSTCEIVFSGRSATTSSSAFEDEYLTCQMYLAD
uniref:FBD domain-containing protein n=1 Tax=Chenopodium quinoa TaxID=63459 RepID=A0A803NEI4_CHEQI